MKQVLILFLIILSPLIIRSQVTEEALKEYFLDAEFFLAQEQYVDALYDYMELYNKGFKENANINYRIGICYLNISGQKDKAIPYFLEAVKNIKNNNRDSKFKEVKAPMDAYLFLGNAYRVDNQLDKAIEIYNEYKKILPSSDKDGIIFINNQIEACVAAKVFMANPVEIKKTNFGEPINSSSSNFKAVISGNGSTILYMNELPFYHAVYYSTYKNGTWAPPINITPNLQSDGDQYVTSVSFDGTVFYLTKEDNFNSDIYVSKLVDGLWQKSLPLNKKINTKFWESHASISKDGKTLYFTSNRNGGFGGMDIYKSVPDVTGDWGDPVNLGPVINTPLNEDTPFITENGRILYFSSQGHKNMGGYDIFRSEMDENGNWTEPVNLGYPLNTTDDDLFYYPLKNGRVGYISLFEPDGFGKEDIYKIEFMKQGLIEEEISEELTQEVTEKEALKESEIELEVTQKELVAETEKIEKIEKVEVETETEKIEVVLPVTIQEVTLTPVYFAFDSYTLTPQGKTELGQIVMLANKYPDLSFELIGLTDAIGSAEYNKILSEKRAQATKNYLLSAGVSPGRLVAVGYGETRFVAINDNPDGSDNPEGRKYNRRVEIEIKGTDLSKISIRRKEIPEHLRIK